MIAIIRVFKIGFIDFWRNRWLSLAATVVMTLTVLTMALFALLSLSVNQTTKVLQEKIDIAVFIKDEATEDQVAALQTEIGLRPDVKEVRYTSKEDALAQFREASKPRPVIIRLLDLGHGGSIPRSIVIKANDPSSLQSIADSITQSSSNTIVSKISYEESKASIDRYISVTQFVERSGWILSGLFILIAILVIYNTIRLTIYMRKTEIEIMQLVGATGWYIKFPLILEGVLYGIIATVVSTMLLFIGVNGSAPFITRYVDSSNFNFNQFFVANLSKIIGVELLVAVMIGGICSYLAIRKHLK